MFYYHLSAKINNAKWCEGNEDRRTYRQRCQEISLKTGEYNSGKTRSEHYFVYDISGNRIFCGIVLPELSDIEKCARSFFKRIRIPASDFEYEEITFKTLSGMLHSADMSDLIEDDDAVLEKLGIDKLNDRYARNMDIDENILDRKIRRERLYKQSQKLMINETMEAELDRIYSGTTAPKAYGHPVHYFIETDNYDTRKETYRMLLQGLYDNKRIKSRRYSYISVKTGDGFSRSVYKTLYKSSIGGAVVVRFDFSDDPENERYADARQDIVDILCETMLKYRNSVLTVFCLPRTCEKIKRLFLEQIGFVGMVDIKENHADKTRSGEYLKSLCRDNHIRADKKLLCALEDNKMYYPDELCGIFEEWYNNKIKTAVYPQYKDIKVSREKALKEKHSGAAIDELNVMTGLDNAKQVIGKALNYYKIQKIYKDKGIKQDRPAMHMVFTGNPGTAKTTVARLFARIMKENGLLSKGHLVEVGRSDLVGKYVGWTAQIVKEKFKAAMGGVLFIDEAYSLANDNDGSYGAEAIDTIVQEMENRREDLVVIFAGYNDEMEHFLSKNPGLRSRIAFHVPFADYSTEELCEIARAIGKSKGVTITDGAVEKLSTIFDTVREQADFGNGRYVRNIIEASKMNQANRIVEMDPDKITKTVLMTLEDVDIEIPVKKTEKSKKTIGFCA